MEVDDEQFIEELTSAINPFLREEITLTEYLSLSQSFNDSGRSTDSAIPAAGEETDLDKEDPPSSSFTDSDRFSKPITNLDDWIKPYVPKKHVKEHPMGSKEFFGLVARSSLIYCNRRILSENLTFQKYHQEHPMSSKAFSPKKNKAREMDMCSKSLQIALFCVR